MFRILVLAFLVGFAPVVSWAQNNATTLIGVLGCIREKQPVPAFTHYIDAKPDLCLWIGDNVYGDTKSVGLPALQESYKLLGQNSSFNILRKNAPYMATWDDHDFGLNDGGKSYPLKVDTRKEFIRFWKTEKEIPEDRDGIYYAKTFKDHGHTYQVIMLDVRYNRDSIGSNGDVLGENQWKWLEGCLKEKAELRFIVSGFQILLDKESGSETWANFSNARQRLFNTINNSNAKGVVFLTGDQHYGEVCRLKNGIGYDAIELQFCGLNQTEKPEFNSYRVSTVATSLNSSAYIKINWEKSVTDLPHLLFKLYNTDNGGMELEYRINLSELGY
jgi:alkaline phosphatase D